MSPLKVHALCVIWFNEARFADSKCETLGSGPLLGGLDACASYSRLVSNSDTGGMYLLHGWQTWHAGDVDESWRAGRRVYAECCLGARRISSENATARVDRSRQPDLRER